MLYLTGNSEAIMMIKKYRFFLFVSFILIGGCSNDEGASTPEQPVKEHVFQGQTQSLQKAKDVEQILQGGADKRRQAIEEQIR